MFAQYTIHARGKEPKLLALSALFFEIKLGKKQLKIQLEDLSQILIEKRRKLAPLVTGGVITSLSLLSLLLYSPSLELVGLIAFGLLLTYFGMMEYTVLRLDYANTSELVWLPVAVKLEAVRPFVAILEFYISRRRFPILYASPVARADSQMVHYESAPVKASGSIIYQFGKSPDNTIPQVPINPALLDHVLEIEGQGKVIAESEFLINQPAVIDSNSINLT